MQGVLVIALVQLGASWLVRRRLRSAQRLSKLLTTSGFVPPHDLVSRSS